METSSKSRQHLSSIRALILDMDGVLWRGEQPIGDLPMIFADINRCGCRVVLATNNSTLTAEQYREKLARMGVAVECWQIVNSSVAVAHFLRQQFPKGGPVYMIGEVGLAVALQEENFYHSEAGVQAVVVGMDRQVTYDQMTRAALLIRSGCPFIGTNPDKSLPTPAGLVLGTGAILAAIEAATDVAPHVIGKPEPEMYRVALERLGVAPHETLVIGDRLETDIAGAQALGCHTALVLSGVTSMEVAHSWVPAPDIIATDLAEIVEHVLCKRSG